MSTAFVSNRSWRAQRCVGSICVYSDPAGTGAAWRHCASTRSEGKELVEMPRAKRESNGKNPPLAAAAWAMADDPGLPPCADRLCLWRENPHLSLTTYNL